MYLALPLILWLTDVGTRRVAINNIAATLVILFLIFGGKYFNGWDWLVYNRYFECSPTVLDSWQFCSDRVGLEPGWDLLNRVVKTFSSNVQVFYMTVAGLQIAALLAFARRFGYRFALLGFVWVVALGWPLWMQVLRQGMAVSCFLIAAVLLANGRRGWAAALALLAVSFHYSAAIPLAVALLALSRGWVAKTVMVGVLAGGVYLVAGQGLEYVSERSALYADESVTFNITRLLRYLLFAPLLFYVYRHRAWLREWFGPKLYDVGRYLVVCGVLLLPFSSLTWSARLIIYALVPLVLAGTLVIGSGRVNRTVRWLTLVPLLALYAYSYVDPFNRVDVEPFHNYFVSAWTGQEMTYSEAFFGLLDRLCDIGRCNN